VKIGKKKYLYFTHSDYDHIIGYGAFKEYETIASQNFIDNPKKEQILSQIKAFDDSYYINRKYKIEYPVINHIVDNDAQTMELGGSKFLFWQAVGHNPDGILILDIINNILVVGDYMSNVEFPYIYTSVKEYKLTLDKIESIISNYDVKYLISGHGDLTSDKSEMTRRLKDSRSYISQLEYSVTNNKIFDFAKLMESYQFPIIMKEFHMANVALASKELIT
jgi:glyoxylase-like metal-dependent hydrolase (beta-lactamase superfamily II)